MIRNEVKIALSKVSSSLEFKLKKLSNFEGIDRGSLKPKAVRAAASEYNIEGAIIAREDEQ